MITAPSRFSTNGQHGFPSWKDINQRIRVFIDGDSVRMLVAYDVDEGWVDVPETDEKGEAIWVNGQLVIRRIKGSVKAFLT